MTEAEAKGKWCPMARAARGIHIANVEQPYDEKPAFNRLQFDSGGMSLPLPACACLGSRCACWLWLDAPFLEVWTHLPDPTPEDAEEPLPPPAPEEFPHPRGEGWRREGEPSDDEDGYAQCWARDHDPARHGRCGLVSVPNE
jgi:hypothetical protein